MKHKQYIKLGQPTNALIDKLPSSVPAGMFRAIVKPGNAPNLKTFYRTTESWEEYLKKRKTRNR